MNVSCGAVSRVSGAIAPTGQALTQAPQSTQATGSIYSISDVAKPGSSGVGWMQFNGHATNQDPSVQHDWVITCGISTEPVTPMRPVPRRGVGVAVRCDNAT